MEREEAIAKVLTIARSQGRVVGRRQAYDAGLSRAVLRAQIAADRWQATGRQTFAVHNGELSDVGLWWRAVLEVGPTAALAGVTALIADGLEGFEENCLHVIAPKSARPRRLTGVRVHESRRFAEADINTDGIRRQRPAVAAIHGALWAVSDRQAALILVMTVQQRLATAIELIDELKRIRRHKRRNALRDYLVDIGGGSESLNELDVLAGIRRRGLPEPSRQPTRRLWGGKVYLDVDWDDWKLVLEIDGGQHDEPEHRAADTLRDLEVTAEGSTVIRIASLVWRLEQEAILDRLAAIFVSRGWSAAA